MSSEVGGLLSFVDLFSGAGGLSLGFTQAGFKSIFAIDSDRYAIDTYRTNFGDHAVCGDIRKANSLPPARVVVGGPPCQGFSRLGKKVKKERQENHLWQEYMRYVETARPEVFVIENVPEFLKDPAFAGVRAEAARLDYEIAFGLLNAADFGVPQRRIRAFVIGSRIGSPALPEPTHRQPGADALFADLPFWRTVRDAIGDLPLKPTDQGLHNSRSVSALSLERYEHVPPGGNRKNLPDRLQPPCWRNKTSKSGGSTDLFGRLLWDSPALTIRTQFLKPEKGRYLHPAAHRSLTLREGARLQTFPDDFAFCGSAFQIAKQIGNAVPVELARKIALSVRDLLSSAAEDRPSTVTALPAAA